MVIDLPDLPAGNYSGEVVYGGDENHTSTRQVIPINVARGVVVISVPEVALGDSVVILVLPDDAIGTVNVTINGTNYNDLAVNNGKVEISVPSLISGSYPIGVVYSGDCNYYNSSYSGVLIVKDKAGNFTPYYDPVIGHGNRSVIVIELPDDATGSVNVTITGVADDGTVVNVTVGGNVVNGTVVIDLPDLPAGNCSC